ncbi:MAG: hypothetical protein MUC97_09685 [Bernardetiaceae bacterium]|nr:hypothetical protein [Bernardetiaceae bacterium]
MLGGLACSPLQQANQQAKKNQITVLYPSVKFDSLQAKAALAYGNTNIEGLVFTRPRTQFGYKAPLAGKIIGSGVRVILYPVTPHLEAWHKLRAKRENRRTRVYLDDAAGRYCLVTTTDNYGRYKFERLKPGRYFLHAIINWGETKSYDAYQGSGYSQYGTTDYYTKQSYTVSKSERVERFIDIEKKGGTMEINLK